MQAGLQVFSASGALKIDLSDRIARYLGMVFTEIGTAGIITNAGLLTGTPFCTAHMIAPGGSSWPGNNLYPPEIIFSADTMYWGPANAPHRLMMWVY